ncbi:hypothetical protein [Actinomadura atramentaria]|uniref:hypothetical protein n=1 Tax=Actinomadura atramentaria TaxID=1990 RepID=UPI000527C910|nr:hypothetical protein [Actinomadura atramentaria]
MVDSVIRTLVPIVVGALLAQAARLGFDLPEGAVSEVLTAVLGGAYYVVVRAVEHRVPLVGRVLLGLGVARGTPVYRPSRKS